MVSKEHNQQIRVSRAFVGREEAEAAAVVTGDARVALARIYRKRLAPIHGLRLLDTDLEQVVPPIQPVRV
jgi:hypothetical protein